MLLGGVQAGRFPGVFFELVEHFVSEDPLLLNDRVFVARVVVVSARGSLLLQGLLLSMLTRGNRLLLREFHDVNGKLRLSFCVISLYRGADLGRVANSRLSATALSHRDIIH